MKWLWAVWLSTVMVLLADGINVNILSNSIVMGSIQGKVTTKRANRQLMCTPFKTIEIGIPLELRLTQSSSCHIQLEAQSDLLDRIDLKLEGGALIVDTSESLVATQPILLHVAIPHLNDLKLTSVATVYIKEYQEDHLNIFLDGASEIFWDGGSIGELFLHLDGSYTLHFTNLLVDRAEVIAEGSGEIVLENVKSLNVNLSDTVTMRYGGHPKIIKKELNDLAELIKI